MAEYVKVKTGDVLEACGILAELEGYAKGLRASTGDAGKELDHRYPWMSREATRGVLVALMASPEIPS